MKSLKIITVSALVLPVLAFGQIATTTLPNPGLTPDSPYYFLNRVSEALQEFFTFSPEAKARLELQFAAERIAEIKAMIAAKGATAPGIDVAKTILNENLAKASSAVTAEKAAGKDVSELAKEVSDRISSQKLALKGVFGDEQRNLNEQEKSIKEQIKEADKKGDAEKTAELVKDLSVVNTERTALKKHDDEGSQEFDNEDDKVDSTLELKDQALNAINDVKLQREEVLLQLSAITAADLALVDKAIASAEDLLAKGNYQASKELAHQAEKALERVKDADEKKMENELEKDKKTEELMKKYEESRSEADSKSAEAQSEAAKKQAEAKRESSGTSTDLED